MNENAPQNQGPKSERSASLAAFFPSWTSVIVFTIGLAVLGYAGGFMSLLFDVFPAPALRKAMLASHAAFGVAEKPYVANPFDRQGATVLDAAAMAPGATLVVGWDGAAFSARLIDKDGAQLHRWHKAYSAVWPKAAHLDYQAPDDNVFWQGVSLLADGSLVFNFQSGHFPYGGGLVKLDRNSNVVWALSLNTHHDVTPTADGGFWVASQVHYGEGESLSTLLSEVHYDDRIIKVNAAGEVEQEIALMEAIMASDHRGLLNAIAISLESKVLWSFQDPLHLNNVEALAPELAPAFPLFEAGDVMLSLRNLNAITVMNPETRQIKWSLRGPFTAQHDPDFLPNGHIILFDNLGVDENYSGGRLLEIDPLTQKIVWRFEEDIWSPVRGQLEVASNGNVIFAESQRGRVLEVSRTTPAKVVWEYINHVGADEAGESQVGIITHAMRVPPEQLNWLAD